MDSHSSIVSGDSAPRTLSRILHTHKGETNVAKPPLRKSDFLIISARVSKRALYLFTRLSYILPPFVSFSDMVQSQVGIVVYGGSLDYNGVWIPTARTSQNELWRCV